LLKNKILSFLESLLGKGRKSPKFFIFTDPLGNFEISYPKGWRFDRDIAVVSGKYTISFSSRDSTLTISLDTAVPAKFDFAKYAKKELESPSSGIYTKMRRSTFRDMAAYRREYSYESGGEEFFGGGVMFNTGSSIFSISWGGPEKERNDLLPLINHMLSSLVIYKGFVVRRRGA
jgi:hypothetical protein